jgi:hypothetical protein
VSKRGAIPQCPAQPGADRGLCRSSTGGGSAGPRLSGLERGVSRDPEGPILSRLHSRCEFQDRSRRRSGPKPAELQKLAAVCTYGASRTTSFLLGDPPKRVVKRLVRSMPGHAVRCDYLAYYDMEHSNPEQRGASLEKVNEHLRLGGTVRLTARLRPQGCGGRRISDRRYKALG